MWAYRHVTHKEAEPCGVPSLIFTVTMTNSFLRSARLRKALVVWQSAQTPRARLRILMRQCGAICRQKLREAAKFAVKNGLEVAGGMDQPAAVNRLHRQRFSTVELYRTPHDRGPSVEVRPKRWAVRSRQVRMKAEHNQMEKIEWRKARVEWRKTALNGNGEALSRTQKFVVAMAPAGH